MLHCLKLFLSSEFITALLHNVGAHIDPIKVISKIRKDMEIPGLRDSLVKILQDYNLQVSCCLYLLHSLSHQHHKLSLTTPWLYRIHIVLRLGNYPRLKTSFSQIILHLFSYFLYIIIIYK